MSVTTIFEFDTMAAASSAITGVEGLHAVDDKVYAWLEAQCLRASGDGEAGWLRLTQRRGRRAVQVTSFVGVIRAPNGCQIEVLPKIGKAIDGGAVGARRLLIQMVCCLPGFRHVKTESAEISATRMPLLEVFIAEFLRTVEGIVKRGLRSDYSSRQDNLFSLRGKLLMGPHLRQNLCRADRFFTEHDEFLIDRPENRLLHAALRRVLVLSASQDNQKLARELQFVFSEVPPSTQPQMDSQRVRLDRGMGFYADALAWARLILDELSPLTGTGSHRAPSLLFPMEAVFEAYVANHLAKQLRNEFVLKAQTSSEHLVAHRDEQWFRMKPDLLVRERQNTRLILDTKWKLLDAANSNAREKYQLSQGDFYQLYAYGHHYLNGVGDVALVYPKSDAFSDPLPVFEFPKAPGMRLWVLPFCLQERRLKLPDSAKLGSFFRPERAPRGMELPPPLAA